MDARNLVRTLKTLIDTGISAIIAGNHGIGKSAVVKQFQEQMSSETGEEWGFVDIRLSQQDVGDLRGIPFRINGSTFFAPPLWLPVHPEHQADLTKWLSMAGEQFSCFNKHAKGVLFLDEFNRATREVMQCAFELVLDRRLGGVKIPDGWLVVAAVNNDQDIYQVQALDPALQNRFISVEFKPDPEEWFNWAKPQVDKGALHPAIYSYLQSHESRLIPSKEEILKAAEEGSALFTPRSWAALGKILAVSMANGEDLAELADSKVENYFGELGKGLIGTTAVVGLISWLKTNYKTLNAKEVINNLHKKGNVSEKQLRSLALGKKTFEIAAVVKDILETLKLPEYSKLSDVQMGNLTTLVELLPSEQAMNLFTTWAKDNKPQLDCIYSWVEKRPGKPTTGENGKASTPFKAAIFSYSSRKAALAKTMQVGE